MSKFVPHTANTAPEPSREGLAGAKQTFGMALPEESRPTPASRSHCNSEGFPAYRIAKPGPRLT